MDDLDAFMKRLIVGAHDVYFRDVIKAATGNEVLKLTLGNMADLAPLKARFTNDLSRISDVVKKEYNGRANELSNYMEQVVSKEINTLPSFKTSRPEVNGKGKQAGGYPDLIVHVKDWDFYLEVKTFQTKTKDSSLRTFYYKPGVNSKVTRTCSHILIAFEVESKGGENRSPFILKNVKILDLYTLKVNLKPEFNASNVDVYRCDQI